MKRNNRITRYRHNRSAARKRSISVVLTLLLLATVVIPSFASSPNTLKEEVIYINLNLDGSVSDIYVVNSFEITKDGKIIDYGDYTAFRQLTDSGKIEMENEVISIDAKAGKLYYEGTLKSNSIPWIFSINYFLNGKECSGEDLAGKTGALEIKMGIRQNKEVINTFFDSFALQVGFSFDSTKCKDIVAKGATLANAGKNKQVNFTILPGKGGDIGISTNVVDFEMEGISVNAIPMNLDFDFEDDTEMTSKLKELRDGVAKLDDGAVEIRDGVLVLSDGTKELKDGVVDLNEGVFELADGTGELAEKTDEFVDGVTELNDGAKELYKGTKELYKGTKDLNKGAKELLSGAVDLHSGAKSISSGLNRLSSQNSAIVGGSGQIFDFILEGANDQLKAANPDAPTLTHENFKDILDQMLEQIGGSVFQGIMDEMGESITSRVTGEIMDTIILENPEAEYDEIAAIMASKEVQTMISEKVYESVLQLSEQVLSGNEQYIALYTLREQLSGFSEFHQGLKAYTSGVSEIADGAGDLTVGMRKWRDGMDELKEGIFELKDGVAELHDGVIELKDGTAKLLDGSIELQDGIIELNDGVIELKDGVIELLDGAIELHDGVIELRDGTVTMAEGTFKFRDKTKNIEKDFKDTIKDKIDEMLGRNYEAVSFVSEKNTNIESVQFVMQTEGISIAEIEKVKTPNKESPTFIDRLLNLFGLR